MSDATRPKYDPAKLNARIAEIETDVAMHDALSGRLRTLADDEDRDAARLRGNISRLQEMLTETEPAE